MNANLAFRLQHGGYQEVSVGVFAADGVRLPEQTVCDVENGPILLDENVQVGPFCYLQGPIYAGPKARISEHASLKTSVSLGRATKVGGEVSASIIEPYSNKQHHGYLGHAYLGSWVNLGAGTSNSDLKNTYGQIRVEYADERVDTGMQFLGCIVGDYSKTAINTSIFTGKVVGACSMVYGTAATNVPSFANYARSFGQVTELPPEVVAATQRRVFQRRGLPQRPCDIQLLHDMYSLVQDQRDLPNQPPSL